LHDEREVGDEPLLFGYTGELRDRELGGLVDLRPALPVGRWPLDQP
jgi:hypothetical protein